MALGRHFFSSALLHFAAISALWVALVPSRTTPVQTTSGPIETVLLGSTREARLQIAPTQNPASTQASASRTLINAAQELRQIHAAESPRSGRAATEYTDYFSKIREQIATTLLQKDLESLSRRGVKGRVIVKLVLSPSGEIVGSEIIQSSGFAQLDLLAADAVRGATPFPEPTAALKKLGNLSLTLPIEFGTKIQ